MAMTRRVQWATALLFAVAAGYLGISPNGDDPAGDSGIQAVAGNAEIARLFQNGESGVVVEGDGVVEKLLRDDNDGSRHQRFLLRIELGPTLLVAHNIDLAPRVESIRVGDRVLFRGQYEWNGRGGVVHWTHHDPAGRRKGGWLQHDGDVYK